MQEQRNPAAPFLQAEQLCKEGVAVLRGWFGTGAPLPLREAAERCFAAVETDESSARRLGFNPYSHSLPLSALVEFGCDAHMLTAPLAAPGMDGLITAGMGEGWVCAMEHCWVRKKFASRNALTAKYHAQDWHQDGALGVRFPPLDGEIQTMPELPMTELLTVWIPLNDCGRDSPGLEFVKGRQSSLLHYSELKDGKIRRRFAAEDFHAPVLALGDGLVFLNSVLHRTCTRPEMRQDRLSVEYRIFPRTVEPDAKLSKHLDPVKPRERGR